MTVTDRSVRCSILLLTCLIAVSSTGCTSVISSAYLRDAFWDSADHAAQADDKAPGDEIIDDEAVAAAAEDRREAAIEEAVGRLSKLGALDEATRTTLIETLQGTAQEDWPAVVDAFGDSLAERGATPAATRSKIPEPHIVAKADLDAALSGSPKNATPAAQQSTAVAVALPLADAPAEPAEPPLESVAAADVAELVAAPETVAAVLVVDDPLPPEPASLPPEPASEKTRAELAIRNACFATRVQAWGVVNRFPSDEFSPGQDVIVYFELDGLTAGESPAGHTTCIDTVLRLRSIDGTTLQDWSFEPIAETCRARRHDYFARYVVRIPDTAVGADCRLEVVVTDTLSGAVADAALPLTVASPAH